MPQLKHAVITGGQGDLAQAIAEELGSLGYLVDAPGRKELDVTSSEQVSAYMVDRPGITLLVNCAGITRDRSVARLTEGDWDAVLDTNLTGAFRCARQVVRQMLQSRTPGHLIQIGSFASLAGDRGQAAYAAAKAGLIGLTRSLAREVGARGDPIQLRFFPVFLRQR